MGGSYIVIVTGWKGGTTQHMYVIPSYVSIWNIPTISPVCTNSDARLKRFTSITMYNINLLFRWGRRSEVITPLQVCRENVLSDDFDRIMYGVPPYASPQVALVPVRPFNKSSLWPLNPSKGPMYTWFTSPSWSMKRQQHSDRLQKIPLRKSPSHCSLLLCISSNYI